MLDNILRKKVVSRLARIEGQVAGIRRMVEEDAYCVDLLNQISAVQAALAKVGGIVLENHMETCVAQAFSSGKDHDRRRKTEEITDLFRRYGHIGSK